MKISRITTVLAAVAATTLLTVSAASATPGSGPGWTEVQDPTGDVVVKAVKGKTPTATEAASIDLGTVRVAGDKTSTGVLVGVTDAVLAKRLGATIEYRFQFIDGKGKTFHQVIATAPMGSKAGPLTVTLDGKKSAKCSGGTMAGPQVQGLTLKPGCFLGTKRTVLTVTTSFKGAKGAATDGSGSVALDYAAN